MTDLKTENINDKKTFKVLHIVDNLSISAGVSSMIMNLFRNIDKEKIQFDFLVASRFKDSYENEVQSLGGAVYYFSNPLSIKTILSSNKQVKDFFRQHCNEYSVVHLHSPTISEFTIRHAKRYGVKNIIVHSHSSMSSTSLLKSMINSILTLRIKRLANHYWACSKIAGEYLFGEKEFQKGRVSIINNAIDADRFVFDSAKRLNVRNKMGLADCFVVAHVAGFYKIKNHIFLIEVIKNVKKDKPSCVFLFIGDGPTKEQFVQKIKKEELDDVCVFLGRRDDVNAILQACDLLVLPSIKEGLPVTVVEAQASGLPCLISNSITEEVKVNDVFFRPLIANIWTEFIVLQKALSDEERIAKSLNFKLSKYNSATEAKRVESLYLRMVE